MEWTAVHMNGIFTRQDRPALRQIYSMSVVIGFRVLQSRGPDWLHRFVGFQFWRVSQAGFRPRVIIRLCCFTLLMLLLLLLVVVFLHNGQSVKAFEKEEEGRKSDWGTLHIFLQFILTSLSGLTQLISQTINLLSSILFYF